MTTARGTARSPDRGIRGWAGAVRGRVADPPDEAAPTGARRDAVAAPLVSAAVAAAVTGWVAWRMAVTPDELHTLSHLGDASVGGLLDSYRRVGDTLPPAWYLLTWSLRGVTGTDVAGVRMISVTAWAASAAVLAVVLRRCGPWAAIAGALVPTASTMVFLGAFARPYALVLLLVCGAVLAWQRGLATGGVAWAVVLGLCLAAAVGLQYAAAAVVVALAVVEPFVRRPRRGRVATIGALAFGVLPLALSAPLVPDAISHQERIPSSAGIGDLAAFPWSAGRPVLLVALVLASAAIAASARRRSRRGRPFTVAPEEVVGAALLVLVPVVCVVGMAVTSGVYLHRYAAPAVVGAALLVGNAVRRAAGLGRWQPAVLIGVVALSVVVAPRTVLDDHATADAVAELPARLALHRGGHDPVLVTDAYTFELLADADPALRGTMRLTGPATYPDLTSARVDLTADGAPDGAFELVGRRADVDAVLRAIGRTAAAGREVPLRVAGGVQVLTHRAVGPA